MVDFHILLLTYILTLSFRGLWCLVPPEAARPRYERSSSATDNVPISNEALFLEMHEDLQHPTYSHLQHRPGEPTETHSCGEVRRVPNDLRRSEVISPDGISPFYQKYTEAYGIPVIGSSKVSNNALQRACYVLRYILADNAKVRRAFYKLSGRVAIIAKTEQTTTIPEHSYLPKWWDKRARGLGATWDTPISTAGEENAICSNNDRYWNDDIVLHEYLHALHNLGLNFALPSFESRIERMYDEAKKEGKWANTYAMSTDREYFSESAQSYLNAHVESVPGNGIHNFVDTRSELESFDPAIYDIMENIFTCDNTYLPRCDPTKTQAQQRENELNQVLKLDCKKSSRDEKPAQVQTIILQSSIFKPIIQSSVIKPIIQSSVFEPETSNTNISDDSTDTDEEEKMCVDSDQYCNFWASRGECRRNPDYMIQYCAYSCDQC